MKKFLFLLLIFFLLFPYLIKADSSKIYNKGLCQSFKLFLIHFYGMKKKGVSIGLTSKINIKNRELDATIHPVSLDSSKIKTALSKIKYIDEEKQSC